MGSGHLFFFFPTDISFRLRRVSPIFIFDETPLTTFFGSYFLTVPSTGWWRGLEFYACERLTGRIAYMYYTCTLLVYQGMNQETGGVARPHIGVEAGSGCRSN